MRFATRWAGRMTALSRESGNEGKVSGTEDGARPATGRARSESDVAAHGTGGSLCAMRRFTGPGEKGHNHHIIRKVDGGSYVLSNRVLLHPVCHIGLHARGLKMSEPAP